MPECLCSILVIRAPSSWLYAWSMFKHILDPGIQEKVKVARAGKESIALLREYISNDQIPAYLGGNKSIDGDPQCRQVLSPGGYPPQEALDRFEHLLKSNGVHDSYYEDGLKTRTSSTDSIDSVWSTEANSQSET